MLAINTHEGLANQIIFSPYMFQRYVLLVEANIFELFLFEDHFGDSIRNRVNLHNVEDVCRIVR